MRLPLGLVLIILLPGASRGEPGLDHFEKKIRPVLAEHCYPCHSQQAGKRKGGLRLDTREGLRAGGDSGPALVPGNSKASLLLKALRHDGLSMPPKGHLPDAVVADFVRWIDEGAVDPRGVIQAATAKAKDAELWSLRPVRRPAVPAVKNASWPHSDIDRFLLARREQQGLEPAGDADPLILARRLHFLLTGLPPIPEALAAYSRAAAINRQAATEQLVERLLASPHFGEHWARHWMDLVCFSESYGIEHDPYIPYMWRYRDYLIRAFNADVPYDRLVREHLAGDVLPPRWNPVLGINESLLGTAYFRFVELYPTPVDPKNEENSVAEIQIDTFGKTFQGLTLACARCHDHKFDPITAHDYHALYGIFASGRLTMHAVDDPRRLHALDDALRASKQKLRHALAQAWRDALRTWPETMRQEAWRKAIEAATGKPAHVLYPLTAQPLHGAWQMEQQRQRDWNRTGFRWIADLARDDAKGWHGQGPALATTSTPGDFAVAPAGPALVTGIYPRGRYSHLVSEKHPGTLRSPSFTIDMKYISVLACGTNEARVRLIVENFPGDELLFAPIMPKLKGGELRWVTLPIRTQYWTGRRAYLEIIPRDEMTYPGRIGDVAKQLPRDGRSGVGIRAVVFHDQPAPPEKLSPWSDDFWATGDAPAARFIQHVRTALDAWAADCASNPQAELLDVLLRLGLLPNHASTDALKNLVAEYRQIESQVPVPQRVVGMAEEEGFDVPLYPRGNYRLAKEPVPRRYLEVLGSKPYPLDRHRTGRLELANEIANPHNPLTARVMVNRLWQHVFGAGLVRSVDNFGHLGEKPSHPELLDHLAAEFVAHGWSMKSMIKQMVLSRTFQLAAEGSLRNHEQDPENRLWSHALVRRLPAESIRDALLQTSGRLDRTLFGLSIPLPPASFQDFYQLAPGPLDGAGRRSIYLEVRRNFPAPFLTIFDWPRPLATTGQRNVTNVPAQGLALLNDPFVLQQADLFAKRALAAPDASTEDRVAHMFLLALGRPPSAVERDQAMALVQDGSTEAWRDLAHGLFNLKEFIFLR